MASSGVGSQGPRARADSRAAHVDATRIVRDAANMRVRPSREEHMKRLSVVLGLLLLSACSTTKYELNPDGSKPVLYPAKEVLRWPVVDGAHQSPSNNARIYIDPSARF